MEKQIATIFDFIEYICDFSVIVGFFGLIAILWFAKPTSLALAITVACAFLLIFGLVGRLVINNS